MGVEDTYWTSGLNMTEKIFRFGDFSSSVRKPVDLGRRAVRREKATDVR